MKKLLILLLFIPFTVISQNIEFNVFNKFDSYLDFVNDAIKVSSTNEAINNAKKLLGTNSKLNIWDDGEDYLKLNNGTYLHQISDSGGTMYLGLSGIGNYSGYIYIISYDKDFNKESNIVRIISRAAFMRRDATDLKLDEIKQKSIDYIDKFFINKCTRGISDFLTSTDAARFGNNMVSLNKFQIYGNDVFVGGSEKTCDSGCETCMIEVDIGYANTGPQIDKYWSHIFYLGFVNKLRLALVETRSKRLEVEYNWNFIIYDYKGRGYGEDGQLDLREINNYDLKAMINFFIEDYNRNSNKVIDKQISPLIFNEEQIKATFEPLDGDTIALSYGSNNDSVIIIKVDPEKWANASVEKRWYILYHELGHDVLNLEHGEGGKMMFNFADKEYSWDDFIEDKEYMLSNN